MRNKKLIALVIAATMTTGLVTPVKTVKAEVAKSVVISEVYGGGGNFQAVYKNDFIELHNPTENSINLEGWKIEYASKSGSFSNSTELTGKIEAGGYYLIHQAAGENEAEELPMADATGNIKKISTITGTLYLFSLLLTPVLIYLEHNFVPSLFLVFFL